MFLLLFLFSLSSFLLPIITTTAASSSSFPAEQDDWGPNQNQNQNQPLLDNTYTAATAATAVPNNLGNSLGTPASQDPSAWWNQNQNQNQVDVKAPEEEEEEEEEGSDNTGHPFSSLLSFDASSSGKPTVADNPFLLASTQATNSNGAAAALGSSSSSSSSLPSANDLNPVLNPSTPPSSDATFSATTTTTTTKDGSNPFLALSPNGEEVNPDTQTVGSSSPPTLGSSPRSSSTPPGGTSNPNGEGQQMALIGGGDDGGLGLPLNLLPTLGGGGDAPVIDLPAMLKPIFNPKIPQPLSFPIRYNDKERLDDPQTPDCDEGMFPFCCNLGPPDPVSYIKNAHKRRDCRTFDTTREGCHWRQNMFCCKCADRSTNVRLGIGCYNVWYRGNPFYDEKRLPNPVKLANPKVDQPQQSGGEEGNAAQELPGELPETRKRPSNLPGTGKALPDSCSKKQLDNWRETNYI